MANKKSLNFVQIAQLSNKKKINYSHLLNLALNEKVLFADESILLEKFVHYIQKKNIKLYSQLFQDIFVSFIVGKNFKKSFLEFGATNGVNLSNTFTLENELGWEGVLIEPSPQWHEQLEKNRPNTKIVKKCVWKSTGLTLDFFMSNAGALSTLNDFKESDLKSMPANTKVRIEKGEVLKVETISLNDVLKNYFQDISPTYISVDTEGSEYDILYAFDFDKYKPTVFTVEHNFTDMEIKIDDLMKKNGYVRIFNKITVFDAWYVLESALKKI